MRGSVRHLHWSLRICFLKVVKLSGLLPVDVHVLRTCMPCTHAAGWCGILTLQVLELFTLPALIVDIVIQLQQLIAKVHGCSFISNLKASPAAGGGAATNEGGCGWLAWGRQLRRSMFMVTRKDGASACGEAGAGLVSAGVRGVEVVDSGAGGQAVVGAV